MSVAALKPIIRDIRADGHISLAEAKMLTSNENAIGKYLDHDEFELIRNVATDLRPTNDTTPINEKVDALNVKNKDRLVGKGVKIAGLTGAALAGIVALGTALEAGAIGAFFSVAFTAAPLVALAVGVGALIGFIVSKSSPVTKEDVENNTEKAQAADNYKKDVNVDAAARNGAKAGGAVAGVFGFAGTLGVAGFALTNTAAATAAGAALYFAVTGAFSLVATGAFAGVAALGAYIYSKVKEGQNSDVPTGAIEASPEAKAHLDEFLKQGTTAKDEVAKGTKIGGIVGGVLSGLGVLAWAGLSATTAAGASMGLMIAGTAFIPTGLACLAVIGVCAGLGALGGFIKSKVTTQED